MQCVIACGLEDPWNDVPRVEAITCVRPVIYDYLDKMRLLVLRILVFSARLRDGELGE
jgi:hypothetical protein